jgi:transposase
MSKPRSITLSEMQRQELERVRDHHPRPYYRERASAILKLADGMPLSRIAKSGLLRTRNAETVREWVTRYEQAGLAGLAIRGGRGRKAAFFPN